MSEATKRTAGAYNVQGQKVKVLYTKDKHKLWADLFYITESQISALKDKVDSGNELDNKDFQKLDSCYSGMKKLLEIEAVLKSDAIASMSNDDLLKISRKIIRERPKLDDSGS
jgi:predicted oxidoreductase (fatty acid repression mutant protein)